VLYKGDLTHVDKNITILDKHRV